MNDSGFLSLNRKARDLKCSHRFGQLLQGFPGSHREVGRDSIQCTEPSVHCRCSHGTFRYFLWFGKCYICVLKWNRENGSTAVLKACSFETCQSPSLQRSSEYLVCVDLDRFVCWWFYWLAGFWIFAHVTIFYAFFLATEVLTRSFGTNVWWNNHKAQEIQSTYQWTFAIAINMWQLAIQFQPFKGWPWLQFFCTLSSLSEKCLAGHLNHLSDNSHTVRA